MTKLLPLAGKKICKLVSDVTVLACCVLLTVGGWQMARAALVAESIGRQAEFFSVGTNDLTQMTFGFSRDDAGKFLPDYLKRGIYEHDPFRTIDQKGVGLLVEMAVAKVGRGESPAA